MTLNRVHLIGRLGKDPEARSTTGGTAVTNLNLATDETWNDKLGEKKQRTEWHRVVAFGRTAEHCAKYLSKGRQVYVEGRIQTREWQDKDGNKRFTTEIVAQSVQFLGGGGGDGGSSDRYQGSAPQYGRHDSGPASGGEPMFEDDDVPF